jgi:hypothetical protein
MREKASRARAIAPGFLVAGPSLRDPNFARTVVLLVEHATQGSIGFVVNRLASVSFREVAESIGVSPEVELPVLVRSDPRTGWVLFDPTEATRRCSRTRSRTEHIAVTASKARGLSEPTTLPADADGRLRGLGRGAARHRAGVASGPDGPDLAIVFDCAIEQRDECCAQRASSGRIGRFQRPRVLIHSGVGGSGGRRRPGPRAADATEIRGAGACPQGWTARRGAALPPAPWGSTTRPKRAGTWKSPSSGGDQPAALPTVAAAVHHVEVELPRQLAGGVARASRRADSPTGLISTE